MDINLAEIVDNGVFQALAVAAIIGVVGWVSKKVVFRLDERKIYTFIRDSEKKFRSTEAIIAKTNLTASRVQVVASKSKKVRRNSKEKESWTLS